MAQTEGASSAGGEPRRTTPEIPGYIDWVVGLIIALGGLALTIGGTVLVFVLDRELLAEGIDSGQITVVFVERDLSKAEMLEFNPRNRELGRNHYLGDSN